MLQKLKVLILITVCLMAGCTRTVYVDKDTSQKLEHTPIVVRVATQGRKITFLKAELTKPGIKADYRRNLDSQLAKALDEDRRYLDLLRLAFDQHFDWSKVYYIPDSLFKNFTAGAKKVCLGSDNKVDQNISPPDDYLLVTAQDPREKLIITDRNGIRLPHPYPYKKFTWFPAFRRMANKEKYISSQVKYFNEKLRVF